MPQIEASSAPELGVASAPSGSPAPWVIESSVNVLPLPRQRSPSRQESAPRLPHRTVEGCRLRRRSSRGSGAALASGTFGAYVARGARGSIDRHRLALAWGRDRTARTSRRLARLGIGRACACAGTARSRGSARVTARATRRRTPATHVGPQRLTYVRPAPAVVAAPRSTPAATPLVRAAPVDHPSPSTTPRRFAPPRI